MCLLMEYESKSHLWHNEIQKYFLKADQLSPSNADSSRE